MQNIKLLIVEDEHDSANVIRLSLDAAGISTDWVEHAQLAFDKLEADPQAYQGLIIDLALPDIDGFELMSELRSQSSVSHLPMIAVTAYHTPELKDKALESGFDAYFAKPLDTNIFLATLERLLLG